MGTNETAQNPVYPAVSSELTPHPVPFAGPSSSYPTHQLLWYLPESHLPLEALLQEDGTKGVEVIRLGAAGPGGTAAQCPQSRRGLHS